MLLAMFNGIVVTERVVVVVEAQFGAVRKSVVRLKAVQVFVGGRGRGRGRRCGKGETQTQTLFACIINQI